MFKTDATVRFGQILSARTLSRYGKFNEYIFNIILVFIVYKRIRGDQNMRYRLASVCEKERLRTSKECPIYSLVIWHIFVKL